MNTSSRLFLAPSKNLASLWQYASPQHERYTEAELHRTPYTSTVSAEEKNWQF